jgi:hypothetical protein
MYYWDNWKIVKRKDWITVKECLAYTNKRGKYMISKSAEDLTTDNAMSWTLSLCLSFEP